MRLHLVLPRIVLGLALLVLLPTCALDRLVINGLASKLSQESGSQAFLVDDDPQLVAQALPFTIKLYETLAQDLPSSHPLNGTLGSLYIMYAQGFIQGDMDAMASMDFEAKEESRLRALGLYKRAISRLGPLLSTSIPGFAQGFAKTWTPEDVKSKLGLAKKQDVFGLYWFSVAWASAAGLDPLDPELLKGIRSIPILVEGAATLDPGWGRGSLQSFIALYYGSMSTDFGGDKARAQAAMDLAFSYGGRRADLLLAYFEAIAVPSQNGELGLSLLKEILDISLVSGSTDTLTSILAKDRARYYLKHIDEVFWDRVEPGEDNTW